MDVMQESCEKELTPSFQTVPEQQPSLAETSDTPMTTEETKLLEHLRGLHGMGIDLTEGMALQLEKLQTKEAKQAAGKTLSHGHLNKLNKVRAQVKTAAKKVEDLDGEWNKFVQNIVQKIQQHALMYQTCRSDMLEVFNNRLAELQAIKKEVGLASRSLLEQSGEIVSVPEIPHVADQMQQMQDILSHVSQVTGLVDLTAEMEEDTIEVEDDNVPSNLRKGSPKVAKFRGAVSPTKVANQHLKQKAEKKEREDK